MLPRLTATLLFLVLTSTAGLAGSAPSYLCSMTGQVRTTCCCKKAQLSVGCETFSRAKSCCEARVSELTALPAAPHDGHQLTLKVFALVVAHASQALGLANVQSSLLPVGSQAPPAPPGPPIFERTCRYLI